MGVLRLDARVVQGFAPRASDSVLRERRLGETLDQDPDRLAEGLACAPAVEAEQPLAVVELEGRPDALASVGELRGPGRAGAAEEESRREPGDPVRIALRGHARRDAPAERDEGIRREGVGDQDGAIPQGGAVGEVQPVPSWAWNRTTDRCSSTRYVRATSRMRGARTFSTFASRRSPKSQDERPSPALSSIPWNVTPSCSYRAQERTCCFSRSGRRKGFGGGLGFKGEKASRTCCIATAGSKPATRIRDALFGA